MILRVRDRLGRFLSLLVAIVAYLILFPLLEGSQNYVVGIGLTLVIPIAGVYAVSDNRRALIVAALLAVPVVLDFFTPSPWPPVLSWGALIALYGFVLVTVLREVLDSESVSLDTLFGAAAAYLLIGLMWASIYAYVEAAAPGSLIVNPANDPSGMGIQWFELVHFSYVTLTTLGYGEITPVSSIARSLSFLEAATGVLYLAFLVAKLVSVHKAVADGKKTTD